MKIVLGILLCVLLFLGGIVWLGFQVREEPITSPNQANQPTETIKKEYASIKTALKIGFIRLGSFIHDFREEIVAVGTLFIAAFTVILAFATGFLYFATRDLVKGAEDTAERQLRAYIGFKAVVTIDNVAQGQKPIIIAPVGNFGQTPAYKVAYSVDAKLLPMGAIFPEPINVPGLRVVNPGSDGFEIRASVKNALTETEWTALANKQAAIYFFGEIVYSDIFSHRTRTTKFRLSHEGELLGSGRMGICGEGNEAD